MKKLLLLSLFSFFFFTHTDAQWGGCDPDLIYADSSFGVYPPPLNTANPDGGITEKACVGESFSFVWTIKIPETVETSVGTVTLDSIIVTTTGAVTDGNSNPPTQVPGMGYVMNPTDGVFTPDDSLACIIFYGIPTVEGTYDMKIRATIFSSDPILIPFMGMITFNLPDPLLPGGEGNYFFQVLPTGSSDCTTNTDDLLASSFSIKNQPNPFSDFTNIEIVAEYSDELNFRVYDMIGKEMHHEVLQVNEGVNNFEFDGSRLSNGIYMYTIEKNGAFVTEKMVINR